MQDRSTRRWLFWTGLAWLLWMSGLFWFAMVERRIPDWLLFAPLIPVVLLILAYFLTEFLHRRWWPLLLLAPWLLALAASALGQSR